METPLAIRDLLDAADSRDLVVAARARRELLNRASECHNHIDRLIDLLRNPNAAIANTGLRTLERIGQPAVDPLVASYSKSHGRFRLLLIGLIAGISRLDVYLSLLRSEINNGAPECRYWAANCLGRSFDSHANWPPDAIELLDDAVEILVSLQNKPEHWAEARMTLKHLGRLPNAG